MEYIVMEYLVIGLLIAAVVLAFLVGSLSGSVKSLKTRLLSENDMRSREIDRLRADLELVADHLGVSFKTVEFKKRLLVRSEDAESRVPTYRPFSKPKLKRNG